MKSIFTIRGHHHKSNKLIKGHLGIILIEKKQMIKKDISSGNSRLLLIGQIQKYIEIQKKKILHLLISKIHINKFLGIKALNILRLKKLKI